MSMEKDIHLAWHGFCGERETGEVEGKSGSALGTLLSRIVMGSQDMKQCSWYHTNFKSTAEYMMEKTEDT